MENNTNLKKECIEYNCPRCKNVIVYAYKEVEIMCAKCMCQLEENKEQH